jgi:dTDP-4-amino-4,6-dideoxygalactose transaminase
MGRQYGGEVGDCPVTEDLSDRLLRLPFYNDLAPSTQERVADAILQFQGAGRPAVLAAAGRV